MSISVSRSLADVEQRRSTCNVSRSLFAELFLLRSMCLSCMYVSVSRSLAYVEQGRSTYNVSRSLSVELFCFAVCVCHVFWFLARSLTSNKDDRPAMSVAISPSSFFASQRVSVTAPNRRELCRSLADSLAKSNKNLRENRLKIDPGDTSGVPESGENRSRDPLRTPRGVQERPEGVSGVSRERPGASPARRGSVRRVAKGAPGRQKGRPGASGSAPRRPKLMPSRIRGRKNRVFFALRVREASSERFFVDFCRFSVFSQSAKCLFRTTPASKNRGSALRAASLVARLLQPRKTSKIDPEIDQKSSKIVSRSVSGALFGRLWSLEAARSSDLERLEATRATRRATRSDRVGRSGSLGVGQVGQVARGPPKALAVIRIEIMIIMGGGALPPLHPPPLAGLRPAGDLGSFAIRSLLNHHWAGF